MWSSPVLSFGCLLSLFEKSEIDGAWDILMFAAEFA